MTGLDDSDQKYWNKESRSSKSQQLDDFKKPSLNKERELLNMANDVSKLVRGKEVKSLKKLADDEFYIDIFEKEFNEIDFHDLKGAQSVEQKAENLQIMIDFLGNGVYEMDLSHIEPAEVLGGNYDHIHRFVKLLHEWSLSQSDRDGAKSVRHMLDMGNSGAMPTADTYENLKNQTEGETIDFYKRGREGLKDDNTHKGTSKFRILSNDKCESNEIFKKMVTPSETPTIRSSLTTSVNTTFLGGLGEQEKKEEE